MQLEQLPGGVIFLIRNLFDFRGNRTGNFVPGVRHIYAYLLIYIRMRECFCFFINDFRTDVHTLLLLVSEAMQTQTLIIYCNNLLYFYFSFFLSLLFTNVKFPNFSSTSKFRFVNLFLFFYISATFLPK